MQARIYYKVSQSSSWQIACLRRRLQSTDYKDVPIPTIIIKIIIVIRPLNNCLHIIDFIKNESVTILQIIFKKKLSIILA